MLFILLVINDSVYLLTDEIRNNNSNVLRIEYILQKIIPHKYEQSYKHNANAKNSYQHRRPTGAAAIPCVLLLGHVAACPGCSTLWGRFCLKYRR